MSHEFGEWLVKHRNRNSPLGDLARDLIRSVGEDNAKQMTPDTLWAELIWNRACTEALNASMSAVRQWKRYVRRKLAGEKPVEKQP